MDKNAILMLRELKRKGNLISIPDCTGCNWDQFIIDFGFSR